MKAQSKLVADAAAYIKEVSGITVGELHDSTPDYCIFRIPVSENIDDETLIAKTVSTFGAAIRSSVDSTLIFTWKLLQGSVSIFFVTKRNTAYISIKNGR